jgi:hypothetical protein
MVRAAAPFANKENTRQRPEKISPLRNNFHHTARWIIRTPACGMPSSLRCYPAVRTWPEKPMANVFIEPRLKGHDEHSHIEDYVVEDQADYVLHTCETQAEAIAWRARRAIHRSSRRFRSKRRSQATSLKLRRPDRPMAAARRFGCSGDFCGSGRLAGSPVRRRWNRSRYGRRRGSGSGPPSARVHSGSLQRVLSSD